MWASGTPYSNSPGPMALFPPRSAIVRSFVAASSSLKSASAPGGSDSESRTLASAASQIRLPCARSNARKLADRPCFGLQYSQQSAQVTSLESQAQLQDCGPFLRRISIALPVPLQPHRLCGSYNLHFHKLCRLGLPQPLLPNRRTARPQTALTAKTPPHSDRSDSVRKPTRATSSSLP
jgi:hypothetical protein